MTVGAPQLGHDRGRGAISTDGRGGEGDLGTGGNTPASRSSALRLLMGDSARSDDVKDPGVDGGEKSSVSSANSSTGTEGVWPSGSRGGIREVDEG